MILNCTFFAFGLCFLLAEKIFPERRINYFREFKLDIFAFFLLMTCGAFISTPLSKFYASYTPVWTSSLSELHFIIRVLLATVLTDFLNYWVHYGMHRSNTYWKAHIYHHRIENLYWFSGLRASFTHYLSFILTRVTVGVLIFKLSSFELLVYYGIGIATNFFQHTNADIGKGWIEWILVSPRIHRLHHALEGQRLKNLGTIFSFWDRMFGTYMDPEKAEKDYALGVRVKKPDTIYKEFIGI